MLAASSTRDTIHFLLDGEPVALRGIDPTRTLLQYLREDLYRSGSKEGCAEGDCGACTVVLAELRDERVHFRAINACIQFLPALDGRALYTVESLGSPNHLHPVQAALVDSHASQCGFCTPGFAMSLFALYRSHAQPRRAQIEDALSGNLCRCTGYRPIVDAAVQMYRSSSTEGDWLRQPHRERPACAGERALAAQLRSLRRDTSLAIESGERRHHQPETLAELSELLNLYPSARLLAGGTDVGLWITKQQRELGRVIQLTRIPELQRVALRDGQLEIGAAVTLEAALSTIVDHYPPLAELHRRFASLPIRNAGTLGGNIANGSPIGDSMPALMVLGASLQLRHAEGSRALPLEDFYLGYQHTALRAGEYLEAVRLPLPDGARLLRYYKIAKRFDQDISALCAAFALRIENGLVREARIAYGGMAETPKRAPQCESALIGEAWNEQSARHAAVALAQDFSPISDMRASADYRLRVAGNLLLRCALESTEAAPRVQDFGRSLDG